MKCGIYNNRNNNELSIKCNCGKNIFIKAEQENDDYEANINLINGYFEKIYSNKYMCECGNYNFFEYTKEDMLNKKTINVPYINVIQNDYKKLIIKRCNLSLKYTKDIIKLKENTSYTMILDFEKEGTMGAFKVIKNDEIKPSMTETESYQYFSEHILGEEYKRFFNGFMRNLSVKTLVNIISLSNENRGMYVSFLLEKNSRGDFNTNTFRNIIKICNYSYSYVEKLINAGFKNLNTILRLVSNRKGNSPKEILNIGRLPMEILKTKTNSTSYSPYFYREIDKFEKEFGYNLAKDSYNIFIDETSNINNNFIDANIFINLFKNYGFKDIRKLVVYLTREVKIQQGISSPNEAIRCLFDYVDMSSKLGISYEKYPKSLKKEHDIVMLNYRTLNNKLENEKFVKVVSSGIYENLKYEDKKQELAIIPPREPKDLIKEGEHLNHCVGSYVERIANNDTMVLFLRRSKEIEQPFVTIEVMNGRIRQVKSQSNRKPDQKIMSFVKDWAKKKELELAIY